MKFGKRRYHHESYLTRQRAKYKRRLKRKFIPGYGRHRAFSYKQWKNRNYQRAYRYFTYPSFRSALRSKWEGHEPYDLHGYGRMGNRTYNYNKDMRTISNWNILWVAFLITMVEVMITNHFAKTTFVIALGWLFYLKYKYYWKPLYDVHHPKPSADTDYMSPQQKSAELDDMQSSLDDMDSELADIEARKANKAPNASQNTKNNNYK